ncbi:MAG: hypothetical protein N2255_06905 [Kiritimatiellae bacterium]|nr:hypothetical protein [Kiritimatiellia bacterium]
MKIDMLDLNYSIEQLQRQWNPVVAKEIVRILVTTVWQAGRPDDRSLALATELRRVLEWRLATATLQTEKLTLLNLCYSLEQGLGNREKALNLARRVETITRHAGTAMDRVRAVFQLAKALLYVDRNSDAVRWTQKGLLLGEELERATPNGMLPGLGDDDKRELLYLLADQASRQVNRISTLGAMNAEVDRAAALAMARLEKLDDPTSMAGCLGMLVEARVVRGRWEEAVQLARRAFATVGYPPQKDPGIAYALCFGALALCHLRDAPTALRWTTDAASISREVGNHECVLEARAVRAVALATMGRLEEALREIEEVTQETSILQMGVLTRWVVIQRAWIRMKAHLPTPVEELKDAYRYLTARGYKVMAAEALYAAACALRSAGRGGKKELTQATAKFKRFGMKWHLELAQQEALPFD